MKYLLFAVIFALFFNTNVFAASDPRLFADNKFGINSLSPEAEVADVAGLVNTNGDWGWIVITIRKNERNLARWQAVFDSLNDNHLIPIVRIATVADSGGVWLRPTADDAGIWADFLAGLSWPTKNRYVQIYNEVNRKDEWGSSVDAINYAAELNKTIDALKDKSQDFFILNAPLDLAADNSRDSEDAALFFKTMEAAMPGIFGKLDGWASHSYPNPDFSASPAKSGRTGIDGFRWELSQISSYTQKDLPVFITETGWRNAGLAAGGLTEAEIADYYRVAFEKVWNDSRVVVVAPFVFNYPDGLFSDFSFKTDGVCLKFCFAVRDFIKEKGQPERVDMGNLLSFFNESRVLADSVSRVDMEIRNDGNYIWDTKNQLKVDIEALGIEVSKVAWSRDSVYPGQTVKASVDLEITKEGTLPFVVAVINNNKVVVQKQSSFLSEAYLAFLLSSFKSILGSTRS